MDSILKFHLGLFLLDVNTKAFDLVTKEMFYESDGCLYLLNLIRNAVDEIEFLQEDLSTLVLFSNVESYELRE